MTSENKKIQGIVKELLSNSLNAKAEQIDISIKRNKKTIEIRVDDDGKGMDKTTLNYAKKTLQQPQRKDMADYYLGLVGNSSEGSGLNLVGLLVSEAEVESSDTGTVVKVRLE